MRTKKIKTVSGWVGFGITLLFTILSAFGVPISPEVVSITTVVKDVAQRIEDTNEIESK